MDGTVLDQNQKIPVANENMIKAAIAAGINVMFATGRGIQSVLPYVEQLGLESPIVTVNGSEVWQKPHDLLSRHELDSNLVQSLQQLAVKHDTWYWAYAVEGLFNKEKWLTDVHKPAWLKFGFYTEEPDVLQQILKTVESWDHFEITNSHPNNLELNPKGISKATGLKEICEQMGITMSQVVAVGDSLNDLAMVEQAGLGVAMANAQPKLKQAADMVTAANDEEGVAKLIERLIN